MLHPMFLAMLAASGGTSYPALTLTSPTFNTTTPLDGAASLNGTSSGTASITLPSTSFTLEFDFRTTDQSSGATWYMNVTDSGGHGFGVVQRESNFYPVYNGSGSFGSGTDGPVGDGAVHRSAMVVNGSSGSQTYYSDGTNTGYHNDGITCAAGAATLTIEVPTTVTIDNLRISDGALYSANYTPASLARISSTLGFWTFDASNGAGS